MRKLQSLVATCLWGVAALAYGQGAVHRVDARPDAKAVLYWEEAPNAKATVFLFPGGEGGFGKLVDRRPGSGNFLVRSVPLFLAQGFNVAILGKPTDDRLLNLADRVADWHLAEVRATLAFIRQQSTLPVWLVGTSAGTVSVAAAGIQVQDPAIAGLVLTSSIVAYRKQVNVQRQDLKAIRLPVLVMHHSKDECSSTPPRDAGAVMSGLSHAAIKKLVIVDGGANPSGDVCAAMHWHGYIGMEKEAVDLIANWIRHPTP